MAPSVADTTTKILLYITSLVLAPLLPSSVARAADPSFHMPVYANLAAPPTRSADEVKQLLSGHDTSQDPDGPSSPPLQLVLVAGAKDHGPGEHDYPAWLEVWSRLLAQAPNTKVDIAMEFPTAAQIEHADVLVFYQRGAWDATRAAAIDPFLARGGGLVYIHWAVDGRGGQEEMAKRIGLSALGGQIRYRHGDLHLDFTAGQKHPISRNFSKVQWVDESYWKLTGNPADINLLASSVEEEAPQPQFWTVERDRGRIFVSIPGHYMWTFDDPTFRTLLLRGIAWVGHRNVDRFNPLVTLDARISEPAASNNR